MDMVIKKSWHIRCSYLQIRDDAAFIYVDASDESKSNWMRWALLTGQSEHWSDRDWLFLSWSQLHTIHVCSMFQVCNVYQPWGGTQPGHLPVLPPHLLQSLPAHHGGSRAQGLDRQGLRHLAGPRYGWVISPKHGMTCGRSRLADLYISLQH